MRIAQRMTQDQLAEAANLSVSLVARVEQGQRSPTLQAVYAIAIALGAEAGFDEDRMVITNAYTGGSDNLKKTFEQAPKHRDERANELCARELDYARGDDFLQIARLDLAAARSYLLKEVPRNSLPALLYQLAFVLVGSLLLPLVHWLNPHEAMGDLRART